MKPKKIDRTFPNLSFNSRLLFKELAGRGITVKRVRKTHIVRTKFKKHEEIFYDIYSNFISYTKGLMIDDKFYAKKFLQYHGMPVNEGQIFKKNEKSQSLKYAQKIGFPVVIKPAMSSHGENVFMNILNKNELSCAINYFTSQFMGNPYFLVEKQFIGEEYRLFITKNNFFAAVHRIPANISGDGKHSIFQLVKKENYRRMHPRNTCLCKILLDGEAAKFLKEQRLSIKYIPKKNEKIFLRRNSNVSTGGNCYEITDLVHPFYKKFAQKILKIYGAPFIGIDLMCKDISKKSEDFVICELNSAPGLSLHMMPELGKSRDVAGAIADIIFPETKK